MGRVRSTLFGGVLRSVLTLLAVAALVVGGGFAAGVLGVPGVADVQNSFGDVNETTTVVETDLVVNNPNPVGVTLGGLTVDYGVEMNDVRMANGTRRGVSVGPGNSTVELRTLLRNDRIPDWWVSHVGNGERTDIRVEATVRSGTLGRSVSAPPATRTVETDVLSGFDSTETRPVNAGLPAVEDPVLYVNRTSAEWGTVTDERTPILVEFTAYNPKPYPIPVTELGYDVTMNDVAVGEGRSEREYVVPPRSTRTLETTTAIRNDRLDEWWVSHLERNQVTDLRIAFSARVDAGPAGTVEVPLRGVGYETRIETDVFGTKNATNDSTLPAVGVPEVPGPASAG